MPALASTALLPPGRPGLLAPCASKKTAARRAAPIAASGAAGDVGPLRPGAAAAAVLRRFEGADGAGSRQLRDFCEVAYLSGRAQVVCNHFPQALGAGWCAAGPLRTL